MTPPSPWLSGHRPSPQSRFRLFCFPSAGGAASMYQQWAPDLPAGVELCRVQPPGREGRFAEPPLTTLGALLDQVETALTPLLDLPFAFFGHSMGSLVAYELAQRLRARGLPQPAALFPSGHRAPHLTLRRRPWAELPRDELIAELREIDGIPDELLGSDELLDLVLPTVRVDLRAYEAYRHQPGEPLQCPIVVFGGDRDQLVERDELAAWQQHTRAEPFAVHVLPGKHFFINDSRDQLLELLRQALRPLLESAR